MYTPSELTGALVLEVRTRHKLSRVQFSDLVGFTGKSPARLNNIEKNDSWKVGDREMIAAALNKLASGETSGGASQTRVGLTTTTHPASGSTDPITVLMDDVTDDEFDLIAYALPVENFPLAVEHVQQHAVALPVADPGVYRFSNSELQTFKRCRRKWWLAWYRKLVLQVDSFTGVRSTGTRVHAALQAWYVPEGQQRVDPRDALERVIVDDWTKIKNLATERGTSDEQQAELATEFVASTNLERAMVEGYVQWLEETGVDAELRIIGSEMPLVVDVELPMGIDEPRHVQFIGLLDARTYRTTDGKRLFVDHKPQPLTAPILTPTGWVKMGELRVGDVISGAYGEPIRVTHVFDRGVDDVYEITLNDGTSVHATSDHPWIAKDTNSGKWRLVATEDLKPNQHRLRALEPVQDNVAVDLPIAPYTLGAWIANGDRRGGTISDGVYETLQETGLAVEVVPPRAHQKHDLYVARLPIALRRELDELNLLMLYSAERFIPDVYIHSASYQQRMALLHALMDCDGSLTRSNSSIYITTSARLASDVAALVRSLGAWAKVWKSPRPSHVGTVRGGYDTSTTAYVVSVRSEFCPFKNVKHATTWQERKTARQGHRGVTSIDKIVKSIALVGREPVRCIEVDSADKLYVTSDYTVSHNTVGDLQAPVITLPQNEQMLHYHLLEFLTSEDGDERCDGALYNMLRRVKRSARAKPPFYDRVEVRHNVYELDSYKQRAFAVSREILRTVEALDRGEHHLDVAYPSPTNNCRWDCDFFAICNMIDDGSRGVNDMINALYKTGDPRDRYDKKGRDA